MRHAGRCACFETPTFGRLLSMRRIEQIAGCSAGVVELPFGRAAIDVDKPADLVLVRKMIEG